jgi:putative transposase
LPAPLSTDRGFATLVAAWCRRRHPSAPFAFRYTDSVGTRQVSDARKQRGLEEENRKLKKLLAESMLDVSTLKEMLGKNF